MKFFLCFILCLSALSFSNAFDRKSKGYRRALLSKSASISQEYKNEFKKFMKTQKKSDRHQFLSSLMSPSLETIHIDDIEVLPVSTQNILCTACWSAASVFLDFRRIQHKNDDFMEEIAYNLCSDLGLAEPLVCQGLVAKHLDIILYIVDTQKNLNEEIVCGLVLQSSNCGGSTSFDWSIEIDKGDSRQLNESKKQIPSGGSNDLKIAHVSDVHVDLNYTIGASTQCSEPICCRGDTSFVPSEFAAGRWGSYKHCDTPFEVNENAIKTIRTTHSNIDFVYFTGDTIDHAIWETSFEANRYALHKINEVLKETLPGIPVYPTIGNHESDPLNVFAPASILKDHPGLSTEWLYEFLADEWSTWLPESALQTVRMGGYYTASPRKGFRVIALNNNECYTENFWLLLDFKFPAIQLQWLHDTLLQAEKDGEYVHILAHMPTGSGSYLYACARAFRQIVERYHETIGGIFVGHTHNDQFNIFYSNENPQLAVNIAWNGGGLTPFSNVNPNYRIYSVEPESYQVVEHETYIYNLTTANLTPEKTPDWYKSYTFTEEYGIDDLSPKSLDELVRKLASDKNLLHEFWSNKYKQGDTSLASGCDDECLQNNLCDLVIVQSEDRRNCNELLTIFNRNY